MFLKSLPPTILAAALFITGSIAPVDAATNQAVLNVSATVTNNCDVLTQPATLTMTLNTVSGVGTSGTSSFTYACTNGASVSVTPAGLHESVGSQNWVAAGGNGGPGLMAYFLYNDLNCTTNQLKDQTAEALPNGTGTSQTYNICGIPNTNPGVWAGLYTDTVTFTFNFGP